MGNFPLLSQNQKVADSLAIIYEKGILKNTAELELLRNLSFNEVTDFSKALIYAEELIELSKQSENHLYLFRGYINKGNKLKFLGELGKSLKAYILGLNAAIKASYTSGEGHAYSSIANVYALLNDHENSIIYYNKAINLLKNSGDTIMLASAILNAGDEYLTHKDYDSALMLFKEAEFLYAKVNYTTGTAYTMGNIGMVYANTGNNLLAEQYMDQAIDLLESSRDYYPICFYLITMAELYRGKDDLTNALVYANKSLTLAMQYQLKQQVSDANLKLSELHELSGDPVKSLDYYKDYVIYRDSVIDVETVKKIADQRTEFEVSLREKEIDLLKKRELLTKTYILIAGILLVFTMVVLLYFRQRFITTRLMAEKQQQSDHEKIKNLLSTQEAKALQSMVKGQESERKRLAQDLHNHFGSLLATIKVNFNGIDAQLVPNYHVLSGLIDQACDNIRNASHELNMGISKDFGLVPALQELTSHLKQSNELEVVFSATIESKKLRSDDEIIVYRIVQELVGNALKHAQAGRLTITLTYFESDHLINIMVDDNGKGFNPDSINSAQSGIGLKSLIEMINNLNGEIHFDSHPDRGTTVNIDLPLSPTPLEEMLDAALG